MRHYFDKENKTMGPYYEKQLKKIIIEYYTQPQKYSDFQNLVYYLHEELIDSDRLIIRSPGIYKTNIMGNR